MSDAADDSAPSRTLRGRLAGVELHGWLHPSVLSAGGLAVMSGFAQFSVTATLADVAAGFGEPELGAGAIAQVGLTGTTLGLGLAVIRLASLASLPVAALADRIGRRRVLLACVTVGLVLTVLASTSPSYLWFVAVVALGRPLLTATNAITTVIAAEETRASDRAKAIALVGAAYAVGAGIVAIVRGMLAAQLGFRGVFALAVVPLALLPLLARKVHEPDRFVQLDPLVAVHRQRFGAVRRDLMPRLLLICLLAAGVGFVTGPANTYLFAFSESVVGMGPGSMAVLVLVAGPVGLVGLVVGRWAADHVGRRVTAGLGMAVTAGVAMITYGGSPAGVVAGYLAGMLAAAAYAPAGGALATEVFPTSVRATAAGWYTASGVLGAVAGLLLFGMLADRFDSFGQAAIAVSLPVVALSVLFVFLPETRGMELEESAPEAPHQKR